MLEAILSILPIFALIAAGYLFGHFYAEKLEAYRYFNRYLLYLGLPSLFFISFARAPFESLFDLPFIALLLGSQLMVMSLTMFFASNFFSTPFGERTIHIMNGTFSNFLLIGIPLMNIAFSEQGLLTGLVYSVITSLLVIPLVNGMLFYDRTMRLALDDKPFRPLLTGIVENIKNPILLSSIIAIILSYYQINLPTPISKTFELLSNTTQPIGLFAVGLFTAELRICKNTSELKRVFSLIPIESWWVVIVKLIIFPLITWFIVTLIVPIDPLYQATMVIMATIPSSNYVFGVAEKYNIRIETTKLEIFLSTMFSVIPIAVVLAYYLSET